ncbi:hypothetical protein HELRODRAFT_191958 [Helobdella robusta]|uniref:MYND-type domain-containing protein n=1 Tax=Helobdella robusta TaxID=6412 RepID=T1FTG2_HELRO|nr:hypothetical protein HELRODRAFT_191958 [Helobdella robusta]ESO03783.1 hypothetical protein HELRODRAFT_191958 [Helobdella robusta]
MKRNLTKDRDILTVGKNLEYMVQAVKGSLTESQQSQFFNCSNDVEVFKFLWSLDFTHDVLSLEEEYERKSDDKCKNFRQKGNEYFKKQSFLTALREYNMAVIHAVYDEHLNGQANKIDGDVKPHDDINVTEMSENDDKRSEVDDGSEISLALGNRSAALFQLGKYQECLIDIETALRLRYFKNSIHKLLHRKGVCYLKLNSVEKAKDSFKLALEYLESVKSHIEDKMYISWKKTIEKCISQCENETETTNENNENSEIVSEFPLKLSKESHETHPEAVKSLEIKGEKSCNSFVVSRDEVGTGDVLVIERPLVSCLFQDRSKEQRCYNCLSRIPLVSYPCFTCTSVIFCSQKCRDASYNSFHKHECRFFALLGENMCSDVGHLAVRMVMKLGVGEVLQIFEKAGNGDNNMNFDRDDLKNSKDVVEKCKRLYDLEVVGFKKSPTNSVNDISKMIEIPLLSCFLAKYLTLTNYISLRPKSDENTTNITTNVLNCAHANETIRPEDFYRLGAVLINNIRIIKRYAKLIRLTTKFGDAEDSQSQAIGIALYPNVISQFKHSCDPSADVTFYNDLAVVRAIREIFPGEEVSISFGPLFHEVKLEKRRCMLWNDYYVMCNCVACFNKWPVLEEMFQDAPGYKCEKCRSPLTSSDKVDKKNLRCPYCNHQQNLEKIVHQLQNSFDSYASGINEAMSGNHGYALPCLVGHLRLLHRYLRQPWPDLVACQEAVKMCYRLQAAER